MTHIPNTPFGRVLREQLNQRQDAADGWHDGRLGATPAQPQNEHYMKGWRAGRREMAREG